MVVAHSRVFVVTWATARRRLAARERERCLREIARLAHPRRSQQFLVIRRPREQLATCAPVRELDSSNAYSFVSHVKWDLYRASLENSFASDLDFPLMMSRRCNTRGPSNIALVSKPFCRLLVARTQSSSELKINASSIKFVIQVSA